ncbi:hypothetical protein [Herpetosiphon sp. NSE202]|uniref:hypothetical protein n=1 Tax=Herpetosiphon sp. NSE202 TaxID=3351349 RepID=UPI0036420D05
MSDGTPTHELDLVVGSMITVSPEDDRAMFEEEKAWVEDVQDLLREEGVEVDLLSMPGAEVYNGGIATFADLYNLRRLAAHSEKGSDLENLPATQEDDEVDPVLANIWEGESQTKYPHLINHQGEGGYYLPVDFAEPIWLSYEGEESDDEEWGEEGSEDVVSFGSSVALARELAELEAQVHNLRSAEGQAAHQALHELRAAAQHSIENNLPLILW